MVQYCVWKIIAVKSGRNHTLKVGITTLGRGDSNTIQCLSIVASRYHCEILLCEDGSIFIKDRKSLNGTFLGSERILPEREVSLKDGDLIGIGVETSDFSSDPNYIFRVTQTKLREDEKPTVGDQTVVPLHRFRPYGSGPKQEVIQVDQSSRPSSSHTKSSIGAGHQDPVPSTSTDQRSQTTLVIPKLETIDLDSKFREKQDENRNSIRQDSPSIICIDSDEEVVSEVGEKPNFTDKSTVNVINIKSDDDSIQSTKDFSVKVKSEERETGVSDPDSEVWTVLSECTDGGQKSIGDPEKDLALAPIEEVGAQVYRAKLVRGISSTAEERELNSSEHGREKQVSEINGDIGNEMDVAQAKTGHSTDETSVLKSGIDENAENVDALSFPSENPSTSDRFKTSNKLDEATEEKKIQISPNENDKVVVNPIDPSLDPSLSKDVAQLEQRKSDCADTFKEVKDAENNLPSENEVITESDKKTNNKEIQDEPETSRKQNLRNSEIDNTIQDIINRRLSGDFQKSEEKIDNFPDALSKVPSDFPQDSFTIEEDFETIVIDDDEELPCSQMFDSIHESPVVETSENLLEPRVDLEDDELSDTDSADEWFQRLSQCNERDSSEDDDLDQDDDEFDYTTGAIEDRIVDEDSDEIKQGSTSELQEHTEYDDRQTKDAVSEVVKCTLQNNTSKEVTDNGEMRTDAIEEYIEGSKPLLRKTPKASKRKLQDSDDESPAELEVEESSKHVKEKTDSLDQMSNCKMDKTHINETLRKKEKHSHENHSSSKHISEKVHQEHKKHKLNECDTKLSKKFKTDYELSSKPGPKCKKNLSRKSSADSFSSHSSSSSVSRKKSKLDVSKDEKHSSSGEKRKHKSETSQPLEKIKKPAKSCSDKNRHKKSDLETKSFSDSDSSTGNSSDHRVSSKMDFDKSNLQDENKDIPSEMSNDNFDSFKEWHLARDLCLANVKRHVGEPINEEPCLSKTSINFNKKSVDGNKIEKNIHTDKSKDSVLKDIEDKITPNTISKVNHSEMSGSDNDLRQIPKTMSLERRPSSEVKVGSELINKEDKIPKHKILTSEDAKLDAVSKKIGATLAKKPIQIIEAKSLQRGRKQSASIESGLNIKDSHSAEESSKWLSKDHPLRKNLPMGSISDIKAYRKQKLADISKQQKEFLANSSEEKSKPTTTAKNTTKITSKSRSEIFLDTLVSSDNVGKDKNVLVEQNDKVKKPDKVSLSNFKIPKTKRLFKEDDQAATNEANRATTSTLPDNSAKTTKVSKTESEASKKLLNSVVKTTKDVESKKPPDNSLSTSVNAPKPAVSEDHLAEVDQILTTQISNTVNNKHNVRIAHVSKRVFGGEENTIVKTLPETEIRVPFDGTRHGKSILNVAGKGALRGKENKKKVKFQQLGDNNLVVYVRERMFEIEEGNLLKPVTKNVIKTDISPVKKTQPLTTATFTSYWEETIYQICKWNLVWFHEKNKSELNKVEPPACSGQVYSLTETFDNYKEYRQGMFPLLLYELWQSLARHFDLIIDKNRPFNIEILNVTSMPVRNQSLPLQRQGEKRILSKLECQMLVDQERMLYPHQGDLVILDFQLQRSGQVTPADPLKPDKRYTKRVLAYLYFNNIRSISAHKNVSPRLRLKSPNARQVMDFTLFTREEPLPIDRTQDTRIVVLKYIKSDLRQFDALDRLPSSPLLKVVCSPKENCAPLPPVGIPLSAAAQIVNLNYSQKKAITSVVKSVMSESTVLHLIHGPPGCGKSEVIIGIIRVLWQSWHINYRKGVREKAPRILLCAPSNAAIDDIFIRLMNVRQGIEKMPKFRMVRIGRTDMTHKNVASLTLEYLVEKELNKTRDILDDEQQILVELRSLEAKKNVINYQLENLGRRSNDIPYIRNLGKKLAEITEMIRALESGKPRKALEGKELRERRKELELQLLENADVIATTLSSCYNGQMEQAHLNKKLRLTCCIVDEATQCIEPETLIPLMLGVNSLILVGDPQQLPATVLSNIAKDRGLERSLFARQQDWWQRPGRDPQLLDSHCHLLNVQYRMHPAIAQWPSEHFYHRALQSAPELDQQRSCALLPYVVLSHDSKQNRHEESNPEEAAMIVRLVRDIMSSGLCSNLNIGVITPYNRQKDIIRRKIEEERLVNVEVGTVDSYQGRERDIVLFSCTRTEGVGFMAGTERLNVALTRARYSLIIIGNFKSLEVQKNSTWSSLLSDAKQRRLYKTLQSHDAVDLLPKVLRHS